MSSYADEVRRRNIELLRESGSKPIDELLADERGTPTGGDRSSGHVPRGRLRRRIAGLELRDAPERADAGVGLEVAGERLDRDDVAELIDELGLWLDEVRPGWRSR